MCNATNEKYLIIPNMKIDFVNIEVLFNRGIMWQQRKHTVCLRVYLHCERRILFDIFCESVTLIMNINNNVSIDIWLHEHNKFLCGFFIFFPQTPWIHGWNLSSAKMFHRIKNLHDFLYIFGFYFHKLRALWPATVLLETIQRTSFINNPKDQKWFEQKPQLNWNATKILEYYV